MRRRQDTQLVRQFRFRHVGLFCCRSRSYGDKLWMNSASRSALFYRVRSHSDPALCDKDTRAAGVLGCMYTSCGRAGAAADEAAAAPCSNRVLLRSRMADMLDADSVKLG